MSIQKLGRISVAALTLCSASVGTRVSLAQGGGGTVTIRTSGAADSAVRSETIRFIRQRDIELQMVDQARKLQLITVEFDKLIRMLDSGRFGRLGPELMVRQLAPNVRSLQRHAADAVFGIHHICSGQSGARTAWVGVALNGSASGQPKVAYPTIVDVERASPAERAGLDSGDVIMRVNGVDVREHGFGHFVTTPGARLQIQIRRRGVERDVPVELAPSRVPSTCNMVLGPSLEAFLRRDSVTSRALKISPITLRDDNQTSSVFVVRSGRGGGAATVTLTQEFRGSVSPVPVTERMQSFFGAQFWVPAAPYLERQGALKGGVPVLDVTDNSQAARAGLKAGDIVTRVGKSVVGTMAQLKAAVDSTARDATVEIEVLRDKRAQKLIVRKQ